MMGNTYSIPNPREKKKKAHVLKTADVMLSSIAAGFVPPAFRSPQLILGPVPPLPAPARSAGVCGQVYWPGCAGGGKALRRRHCKPASASPATLPGVSSNHVTSHPFDTEADSKGKQWMLIKD